MFNNLISTKRLISDLKNAAYLSAFITMFFIAIEVPIVITYIVSRLLVTFAITVLVMVMFKLIKLMWTHISSTTPSNSEA